MDEPMRCALLPDADVARIMRLVPRMTALQMRLVALHWNALFVAHLCNPRDVDAPYAFTYKSVAETARLFERYEAVALRLRERVQWPLTKDGHDGGRGADVAKTETDVAAPPGYAARVRASLVRARLADAPWRWLLRDVMPLPLPPLPEPPWPAPRDWLFEDGTSEAKIAAQHAADLAAGYGRMAARAAAEAERAAAVPVVALAPAALALDTLALTRAIKWWPAHVWPALKAAFAPRVLTIKCIQFDADMERHRDCRSFSDTSGWEARLYGLLESWSMCELRLGIGARLHTSPDMIRYLAEASARNHAITTLQISSGDVLLALTEQIAPRRRNLPNASPAHRLHHGVHDAITTLALSRDALHLNKHLELRRDERSDVADADERAERGIAYSVRLRNLALRFPGVRVLRLKPPVGVWRSAGGRRSAELLAELCAALPLLERVERAERHGALHKRSDYEYKIGYPQQSACARVTTVFEWAVTPTAARAAALVKFCRARVSSAS